MDNIKTCVRCNNHNSTYDRPGQFTTTESYCKTYNLRHFGAPLATGMPIVTEADDICYFCQDRERTLIENGYTEVVKLSGTVGYSELGIHCKIADLNGIVARLRPDNQHYAYVLTSDGRWTQGCFHLFGNGEFSLS